MSTYPFQTSATVFRPWVAAAAILCQGATTMAKEEEPAFTVAEKDGAVEVRNYAPTVWAQTLVGGDFASSTDEGFNRLFRYISGENKGGAKIPMTAPVGQTAAGAGPDGAPEKIPMTAPVAQTKSGDRWAIRFMVPSKYDKTSAPAPTSTEVTIEEEPARTVAVVTYSGTWKQTKYETKKSELTTWVSAHGYNVAGEPTIARYDPPWTLPFLRRNEVHIPVEKVR